MHFYQLTKAAVLATVVYRRVSTLIFACPPIDTGLAAVLLPRSVHDQFLKARQIGVTVPVPQQV
jgi:hypothetical protein